MNRNGRASSSSPARPHQHRSICSYPFDCYNQTQHPQPAKTGRSVFARYAYLGNGSQKRARHIGTTPHRYLRQDASCTESSIIRIWLIPPSLRFAILHCHCNYYLLVQISLRGLLLGRSTMTDFTQPFITIRSRQPAEDGWLSSEDSAVRSDPTGLASVEYHAFICL